MKSSRIMSWLFAALFMVGGTSAAIAQDQQTAPKTAEEIAAADTEWMTEALGLDEEQVLKVQQINLTYAQKIIDLKNAGSDEATMKAQKMELKQSKKEELRQVLTEEQFQTYLVKKEEREKDHGSR